MNSCITDSISIVWFTCFHPNARFCHDQPTLHLGVCQKVCGDCAVGRQTIRDQAATRFGIAGRSIREAFQAATRFRKKNRSLPGLARPEGFEPPTNCLEVGFTGVHGIRPFPLALIWRQFPGRPPSTESRFSTGMSPGLAQDWRTNFVLWGAWTASLAAAPIRNPPLSRNAEVRRVGRSRRSAQSDSHSPGGRPPGGGCGRARPLCIKRRLDVAR